MKINELTVTFESGLKYSKISTKMTSAELYVYAVETYKKDLETATSITVQELQDRDILLSSRAKKTHTIDASGCKTVCGESIDYSKASFGGTRFRCEGCGN